MSAKTALQPATDTPTITASRARNPSFVDFEEIVAEIVPLKDVTLLDPLARVIAPGAKGASNLHP